MNNETRIINFSEINFKETIKVIKALRAQQEKGQKIEWLWNSKGKFTGHLCDCNCFYSISDLQRNGDYKLGVFDEQRLAQELMP